MKARQIKAVTVVLALVFTGAAATAVATTYYGQAASGGTIRVEGNEVRMVDGAGETVCVEEFLPILPDASLETLYADRWQEAIRAYRSNPPCDAIRRQCAAGDADNTSNVRIFGARERWFSPDRDRSISFSNEYGWICRCQEPITCRFTFSTTMGCEDAEMFVQSRAFGRGTCE